MKEMKLLRAPIARPSAAQIGWHRMERTMFIHFSPATWQGREGDDLSTPLCEINPTKLDVSQWVEAAKAFGAKQIVFVAKHGGGFCWWPTETNEYCVRNIPWKDGKGDVLDELYRECQKEGLHFGVYLAPFDRSLGAGGGGRTHDPVKQEAYTALYRKQLTEICSNYDVDELWCDGGIQIPIADLIEKYCPNAVIFQGKKKASIRWCGNEDGVTCYPSYDTVKREFLETGLATAVQSDPDGDAWAGLEVDTTLYDHYWFWSKEKESSRKTLDRLMKYYYQSVGYGEVLLLNANPNTDGLIPEDDMKRYYEFGAEIDRRFGHPIEGKLTVKPNGAEVQFDQMQPVNHVQIREDIVFGQRIRKFEIDAHTADGWKTVYSGVTVGNRHIAVFDTVEADAVRVDVLETAGIPKIMDLTAHNVTGVDIPKLIEVLSAPNYVHDGLRKQLCTMTVAKAKEALAKGALLFDLSEHITMPGQYRFAMECEGDHMKAKDVIPYMDGNAAPEMAAWQGVNAVINRTGVVIDGSTTKVSFTFDIDPKWSDDAVIYWFITRM